jgi:hypothetical protein
MRLNELPINIREEKKVMATVTSHIGYALKHYCSEIEKVFDATVLAYIGSIHPAYLRQYITAIEEVANRPERKDKKFPQRLIVVLTTPGGVVEAVEKMVEVTRANFDEVYFAVPGAAMSAGTIFCMSGDKIFMDYTSSLGPIDPQLSLGPQDMVPALGYIDKVEEFIEKSRRGVLTQAELIMLQRLDLANLRRYEQARNLSVSLLKEWLVKYKFKDWKVHRTVNAGAPVTEEQKQTRAEQIATDLSDNKRWHSHGRMIGIQKVRDMLRLEVEDYSNDVNIRFPLRSYGDLLSEFVTQQGIPCFIHHSNKVIS